MKALKKNKIFSNFNVCTHLWKLQILVLFIALSVATTLFLLSPTEQSIFMVTLLRSPFPPCFLSFSIPATVVH